MPHFERSQSPFSLTPWVRGIIIANAVVFFLTITIFTGSWLEGLFAFDPRQAGRHWWSFVTYMFLHQDFFHIAFNLLMLFFFGRAVEERMGGSGFALYYLICGMGGAILSFAVSLFTPVSPFLGSSGAVFGVALAFAMHWPNAPIYVFPLPVPIKAKWLIGFFVGLTVLRSVAGAGDGIAHLAHLGGFVFGFLYLKSEEAVARHARRAATRRPRPAVALRPPPSADAAPEADDERDAIPDEVDRVLDKISASGMESLTPRERALLDQVSRHLRQH